VHRIARLSATVLVLGESGTGKELIARLIHREGERPDAPFIPVNLAAIPRELVESTLFGHEKGSFTGAHRQQIGKFELAAGGTLFLDEVGDLRLDLQGKLLRAIQEGEIERVGGGHPIRTDFRLIAATNVDLEKGVKEGRFREDLYYRLNVIPIRMPPLRDRPEDLPELATCFLRRYSARFRRDVKGFAPAAMKRLRAHWWPGNIRELENLVERLVAITDGDWITEDDLPFEYQVPASLPDADEEPGDGKLLQRACEGFERNFILKALERAGWNVTAAARHLGIPLSTMKHKMDRLAIRTWGWHTMASPTTKLQMNTSKMLRKNGDVGFTAPTSRGSTAASRPTRSPPASNGSPAPSMTTATTSITAACAALVHAWPVAPPAITPPTTTAVRPMAMTCGGRPSSGENTSASATTISVAKVTRPSDSTAKVARSAGASNRAPIHCGTVSAWTRVPCRRKRRENTVSPSMIPVPAATP
jgi:hypothetical protein